MTPNEVKSLIEDGIPGATATVSDMTGTGDHFQADVVAPAFQGKSKIEQHQMVYRALGDRVGGPIHALKLSTKAG